ESTFEFAELRVETGTLLDVIDATAKVIDLFLFLGQKLGEHLMPVDALLLARRCDGVHDFHLDPSHRRRRGARFWLRCSGGRLPFMRSIADEVHKLAEAHALIDDEVGSRCVNVSDQW